MQIYTLSHPISNEIRYIGFTSQSLEKRLYYHILEAKRSKKNNRRINWIKNLLNQELSPIISNIDSCNEENWKELEQYWIAQFKACGFNLTNGTEGGQGILGYKHTEETKKKLSLLGKNLKHSVESKLKISNSLKGKKISDKAKKNMSLAQKGKPKNPKSIEKMKFTKKGRTLIDKVGEKRANELKKIFSDRMKGNKHNNNPKLRKPILQLDSEGNIIKEYHYSKEIKNENFDINQITRVCKSLRKSYKEYFWKWKIN